MIWGLTEFLFCVMLGTRYTTFGLWIPCDLRTRIQQPVPDKVLDHLGGYSPFLEVGEYPPLVPVGLGQGKGWLFLFRGFHLGYPGIGSVPALAGGVVLPDMAILDADAVYLTGYVVDAHPPHLVAQLGQQIRQACFLGDSHLLVSKAVGSILIGNSYDFRLFFPGKQKPGRAP